MASAAEDALAREFDTLRGRVLAAVESWGLPAKQQHGIKSTVKALSYDVQARAAALLADRKLLAAVDAQARVIRSLRDFAADLEREREVAEGDELEGSTTPTTPYRSASASRR